MAKNVVQDVVPPKRSIRDISVPSRRKEEIKVVRKEKEEEEVKSEIRPPKFPPKSPEPPEYDFDYDAPDSKKEKKWVLKSLIAVFGLALVFGLVSLFTKAQVTVIPKSQTIPLQYTFSALKNQPAGQFGYQIVSVSKSADKEVTAGALAKVETKATGNIVVYNSGSTVQNLLVNTRFADPNGLIFRITKAVSVPKATIKNNQTVPGSVTVSAVADESGDKYNIGLSDFTLPGLKGTPQYKNVYGRSQSAMAGGLSGMSKSVDSTALAQASTDMQNSLKTILATQITTVIPQNFILFPSSISYNFGTVTQKADANSDKTMLSLSGTASAIIFDKALLSQKIISFVASSTILHSSAEVKNIGDLKFVLLQPTTLTRDYSGAISFSLQGDAKIVWLFDQNALKSDILGIKKNDLNQLLQAKYPTIGEVRAKIFPVWKTSFPSDPNKIKVVVSN